MCVCVYCWGLLVGELAGGMDGSIGRTIVLELWWERVLSSACVYWWRRGCPWTPQKLTKTGPPRGVSLFVMTNTNMIIKTDMVRRSAKRLSTMNQRKSRQRQTDRQPDKRIGIALVTKANRPLNPHTHTVDDNSVEEVSRKTTHGRAMTTPHSRGRLLIACRSLPVLMVIAKPLLSSIAYFVVIKVEFTSLLCVKRGRRFLGKD